ncbi:MAG: hypothetical protein HDQ97_01180 [Lachnospiraceae bacterium]|nr:hypothetical protein [Lachnospiraceae bacterium]
MDETEVAVKVEVHDHDIESLKYRVNDLESQSKAIQELAISVNRMAVSMENMLQELNRQGERLEVLEKMPVETGKLIKTAIITALTGSIVGAMMTAILTLL